MWGVNDIRSPTEVEAEYVNMAEFVPIRQTTLAEIKVATESDQELELLTTIIKQGWPECLAAVPVTSGRNCHSRVVLCIRVKELWYHVVSAQCIIDKIHASHLGIQGCLLKAREAFYWPGMSKQIPEFISRCSICNSYLQASTTEITAGMP